MQITSPAFRNGESMPQKYSRNHGDISPPLRITAVPKDARSLVLIMDDPDAPAITFTHWIVFDLDPKETEFGENDLPQNARQGTNDYGEAKYGGPQPPSGEHRYFFRVHALNVKLGLPSGSERVEIEAAMKGHELGSAELMGRYAAELQHA